MISQIIALGISRPITQKSANLASPLASTGTNDILWPREVLCFRKINV
jgi:hypothetical protein